MGAGRPWLPRPWQQLLRGQRGGSACPATGDDNQTWSIHTGIIRPRKGWKAACAAVWMDLEDMMLSDRSQTEKDKQPLRESLCVRP